MIPAGVPVYRGTPPTGFVPVSGGVLPLERLIFSLFVILAPIPVAVRGFVTAIGEYIAFFIHLIISCRPLARPAGLVHC
jgi:hypothetical protein